MATRIYRINYTTASMKQSCEPEYFLSLDGAKAALVKHGYKEISPEDFDDNTTGQWKHAATTFFAESFAYLGFINAEE